MVTGTHLQSCVISLINDNFVHFISLINEIHKLGMEYTLLDGEGRDLENCIKKPDVTILKNNHVKNDRKKISSLISENEARGDDDCIKAIAI